MLVQTQLGGSLGDSGGCACSATLIEWIMALLGMSASGSRDGP